MGGGAADQGKTSEGPRIYPGILDQRRHSSRCLLPSLPGFQEMASLPIPDELVAEIFLRLPTPADVIRASGACVSFRRLVAGRSFLRRFRKLHAPPILGFFALTRVFFPIIPPSPSASAASAVALAADFSFSFLPGPARDWKVQDVRGGRVLLSRSPLDDSLVVCDPLHRRYRLLPLIPEVEDWVPHSVDNPHRLSFLGEEEEAADGTSFTVISIAHRGGKQGAFVFSSSTGQWRGTPWIAGFASFYRYRYAYGCFYGVTQCREKLLVLDTQRMEFSLADLPPQVRGSSDLNVGIAIVEAGEGITRMFVLPYYTSHISYLIRRNNGGGSSQWQLEKTIPLVSSRCSFTGSTERHLLLYQLSVRGTFTLDIKTFQLEKVFTCGITSPCVYRNFPPSLLSSPTISSGVENEAEETLEQGCTASPSA